MVFCASTDTTSPVVCTRVYIPNLGRALGAVFLGGTINTSESIAALGFIGVLIVARPEIGVLNIGIIAAAVAAIGFATSAIITRKLTATNSLTKILFFLTGLQILFGLICAGFDGKITLPTHDSIPWLIPIGIAGLTAHFCLTKSLTLAPASIVMPVDFVRLPLIAIIGMLFYSEPIDILVVVGAIIILLANYINLNHNK